MNNSRELEEKIPQYLIEAEKIFNKNQTDQLIWTVAKSAADKLKMWGLPTRCQIAALLIPILEKNHNLIHDIEQKCGLSVSLALRVIESQKFFAYSMDYSNQLRQLIRQTYIDYPNFDFVLLLFALHDSNFDYSPSLKLAKESKAVYIPLAEILTIWKLHQRWQEESTKILVSEGSEEKDRYDVICTDIKKARWNNDKEMEGFVNEYTDRRLTQKSDLKQDENNAWIKENKRRFDKAYAYKNLRSILISRFLEQKIHPIPSVEIRFLEPGDLFIREQKETAYRKLDTTEEISRQLWLTVICQDDQDCYRALHVIHSLGKPVAPRFSEHFDDYISAVLPNGYRALQTSIIFSFPRPIEGQSTNVLVEFRILTKRMQQLNENGVIEAFYKKPNEYINDNSYCLTWWHPQKFKLLNEQLSGKFHHPEYSSVMNYLKENDLDTTPKDKSSPLYIFTPMGEIIFMDQGCMPLDFAYHIHSDLGNHAERIKVNGKFANYNCVLHNGDIVEITYDRQFSGPDISWLGLVNTSRARQIIRRQLLNRTKTNIPGFNKIQEELGRTIIKYRSAKHYDLRITDSKLETFLEYYSTLRSFQGAKALYDSIERKNEKSTIARAIHPHKIIERLIANELSCSLIDEKGKQLEYPPSLITFCDQCLPVPGEEIVGVKHGKNERRNITIHVKEGKCNIQNAIIIRWTGDVLTSVVVEFQIIAEDRFHILDEILNCIYIRSGCTIDQVAARVKQDGSAGITLIVSSLFPIIFDEIRQELQKIQDIRQIWLAPVSAHEIFKPVFPESSYNPYKQTDAFRRSEFYGREKQVSEIMNWLRDKRASKWTILHGQRRIGKTCFTEYLTHTILPENGFAFAIHVNLQGLVEGNIQSLAKLILDILYSDIKAELPLQNSTESSVEWFCRGLLQAQKLLHGQSIFIVLDEMDYLISRGNQATDPGVFRNLLFIMDQSPYIRWLLVISDTIFQSSSTWGAANEIICKSDFVLLPSLEPNYTDRMIREPTERIGLRFPDSDQPDKYINPCTLIKQIHTESGDNPYFLKRICFHLVEWMRKQERTNITQTDLDHAFLDVLMHGHIYFDHFLFFPTEAHKQVLCTIAHLVGIQKHISLTNAITECRHLKIHLSDNKIISLLNDLQREGSIRIDDNTNIYFPVKIFARYVNENYYNLIMNKKY